MKTRWLKWVVGSVFVLTSVIAAPLIFPSPLFAYGVAEGRLSVHSDQTMPEKLAAAFLKDVQERLDRSPLKSDAQHLKIYIANTDWRRKWLWIIPPSVAGGFIVAPLTRNHAFLSGANFTDNQIIAPSGNRPLPPRTLAYFGAHELAHTLTHNMVGTVNYHLLPEWIREGLADYSALPQEDFTSFRAKIGDGNADLAMMNAHGVYAPHRLLVSYFLQDKGWSIDHLLASRMSLAEARTIAFLSR